MKHLLKFSLSLLLSFAPCLSLHAEEGAAVKQPQIVVLETNLGTLEVTLKPEIAPKACENFVGLVGKHFYDGVIFHRVIRSFMIQGGDPTGTGRGGSSLWGKEFVDECSPALKFDRPGLLAMANRGPNTNGSQFFITTAPTSWLNGKHTIFGEVTKGYEVVKKMEGAQTDGQDRPVTPIQIQKAYLKGSEG